MMASLKVKEILCLIYSGVLFISGALIVGFAVVLCYKLFYHFKFIPNETIGPFIVIILFGLAHLLLTWIGVRGPSSEHDFFIISFVIYTIILLIVEITVGVWSIVLWVEAGDKTLKLMSESQEKYFKHDLDKQEWITLESKLQCCGFNGKFDYFEKKSIPLSCFKCDDKDLMSKNRSCEESFKNGCKEPFVNYVKNLLVKAAVVGFCSGAYQILGIVAFIFYYKALKEERSVRAANRASRLRQSLQSSRTQSRPENPHTPSAPT